MTLQMERGTQRPMRPATATFNLASAFSVPSDPAPVVWTEAGHRLTPVIDTKVMDDSGQITVSSTNIQLQRGIYQVDLELHFVNVDAGADDVLVAVTNFAGSTVHYASDAITVTASTVGDMGFSASVIVEIAPNTTGAQDGICIRAAASGATEISIQPARIAVVRKIGNYGEAGPGQ